MKHGGYRRNWVDLPSELTSSILLRLNIHDILKNAQKVCKSWWRVCKDSSTWTKIETRISKNFDVWKYDLEAMCRHAVDLSRGGLLEINIEDFGSDSLLSYIADRFFQIPKTHQQSKFWWKFLFCWLDFNCSKEIRVWMIWICPKLCLFHCEYHVICRSSNLRRLGAVNCGGITSFGIFKAVVKLPLLEELEVVTHSFISGDHQI